MKKLLIALLTATVLSCVLAASAFAMGTDIKQTTGAVNMRTGPSPDYGVICVVPQGASVYIGDQSGDWYFVDYNGTQGWIYGRYIGSGSGGGSSYTPSNNGTNYNGAGFTLTAASNMRTGPGTEYGVILVLPNASYVNVYDVNNGWAYCTYGSNAGYVSTSLISGLGGSSGGSITVSGGSSPNYGSTWYNGNNYANVYDYNFYCAHNQDVVSVLGSNPDTILQHFVNYGMGEGRQGISSFNVYSYRDSHPELNERYGSDLRSYYLHACGII